VWGHETCAAADGPEALRKAEDFCPHVVLLDLVLPGLGGYEVARQLRQRADGPPPWLVAMTACPTPRNLPDALEADFDQYLAKPCDPERLDCLLHSFALACRECPQRLVTSTMSLPQ
jgi:CheY-like chemotaxis protein